MSGDWEVLALRYAERAARVRGDSFLMDDHANAPHPMDYYLWLLRRNDERILVDTGYDAEEGRRRGRPILTDPRAALAPFGITAEDVATIIVTHLHYDHAGGLRLFPNARLHLQAAEMAFATGPGMCHAALRMPFTGAHVAEAVMRLHGGRVTFHDGDGEVAEGVTVHRIGGHSKGLQAVRVRTRAGWLCLASDAAHFYENLDGKPFPIVVDVAEMLAGFARVRGLASAPELVVPGHDPLVRARFPQAGEAAWRLSDGPTLAGTGAGRSSG
jgi:glyoxylase-like metal-dependent hydrolase (beta-lactamase superfamily II)